MSGDPNQSNQAELDYSLKWLVNVQSVKELHTLLVHAVKQFQLFSVNYAVRD